jgi:hypothetical protein
MMTPVFIGWPTRAQKKPTTRANATTIELENTGRVGRADTGRVDIEQRESFAQQS